MTDASADLASYLIAQNLGVSLSTYLSSSSGTPITYGYMPDAPTRTTTLFCAGGLAPEMPDIRNPNVQVMVRSDDYDNATGRMNAIYLALHQLKEVTLNGTRYILIWAEQEYQSLGWYDGDEGHVLKLVQTFRIKRSG